MHFGEVLAALILFVGAPWAVFSGIAKVKAAGAKQSAGMRLSELKALVDEAVADATAPLVERIEVLEAIATEDEHATRRLDAALLADLEQDDGVREDVPAAVRRRTRS